MLLLDVCDLLTSQAGFTSGVNLFAARRPASPDTVSAVYEVGGLAPVRGFASTAGSAAVERPAVQVICRSASYETARLNAHKAWMVLDGLPDRTINGTRYQFGSARMSPFTMGFDEQDRALVACTYDLVKVPSTTST